MFQLTELLIVVTDTLIDPVLARQCLHRTLVLLSAVATRNQATCSKIFSWLSIDSYNKV